VRARSVQLLAVASCLAHSFAARADEVRFAADRLELDPKLSRLELRGHVFVAFDRYRLTGDRLRIEKTPRGVDVDGTGRVAFCPCVDPPVTVGFTWARVAPTDLVLENPVVRVGGVPVLWLPYLWMRSPRRLGLLPIKVAWRGDDGLLLGSGVHVPIGRADELDVRAAGYLQGGVDIETRLATKTTDSVVRWDYLDESLLALDLRGAAVPAPGATLAWSADALRGPRALTGPILLEEAALRQDRARAALGVADGVTSFGLTLTADSPRGGPFRTIGPVGPGLHAGIGTALGRAGSIDADVDIATLREPSAAATTLIFHHGEARADAHAGVILVGAHAGSRVAITLGDTASGFFGTVGAGGQISAPIVKRFGGPNSPWEHWVTPFIAGDAGTTHWEAPSVAPPIGTNGAFGVLAPGLRTTVGEVSGRRTALTVSIRGGGFASEDAPGRSFVAFVGSGDLRPFSFRQESVVVSSESLAAMHVFNARLGASNGVFVSARAAEGIGVIPVLTRFAVAGVGAAWDAPWVGWFEGAGSAIGGSVGIPWARFLKSTADADYDVANKNLLGVRGSLGYLHPCGCLKVTLWGAERLGRRGFDSYLSVDLAP
jgi:hypothetical protein